jgi:ferredoxin
MPVLVTGIHASTSMTAETRPDPEQTIHLVAGRLAGHGLIIRGGFNFASEEPVSARSILLVGHGGAGYWPHFQAWRAQNDGVGDPLDTWSRQVIDEVANAVDARAVYPSDRPYMPFQQWAMRAEGLRPSPLGILIHPEFGLWHAYRGALLFDRALVLGEAPTTRHLCDDCPDKPCLTACPVGAFSAGGYDVRACRLHVRGEGERCHEAGCLARNACPHDTHRYPAEVQTFHMDAFVYG